MYGNNGNFVCIFCCDLVKIGKLVYTGSAPSTPEIDNSYLSAFNGINLFFGNTVGSNNFKLKAVAKLAYLVASVSLYYLVLRLAVLIPIVANGTCKYTDKKNCRNCFCNKS